MKVNTHFFKNIHSLFSTQKQYSTPHYHKVREDNIIHEINFLNDISVIISMEDDFSDISELSQ